MMPAAHQPRRPLLKTNWDHLRYFNALASYGTLSEAARQLGVSHSTVQRHIAAFEEELQAQLFFSGANGYKLTSAGETLYRETADIQRTLAALSSRLTGSDDELSGSVSVTLPDTISHFVLPDMLHGLHRQYPQIDLSIQVQNTRSNMRDLEADIAIRGGNKPQTDLIGRQAGRINFTVCASANYLKANNLTVDNALQHANVFISLDESFADTTFRDWLPPEKKKVLIVNGFLTAWRLCSAGLGLALLPSYLLKFDDTLIEIKSPYVHEGSGLWVLSHADLRGSMRVKAVRQSLTESLGKIFAVPD